MAKVGHRRLHERTLGKLEPELVRPKSREDCVEVLQMRRPVGTVDEYIIKEDENKLAKERP
jgi:hypothetical protein